MTEIKFKKTLDERIIYSSALKTKYPDRVPVIIEKSPHCKEQFNISKNKYLFPKNMHIREIITIIRKNIKIDSSKAIFIFINSLLIPMNDDIGTVYNNCVDPDGFIYITYNCESTLG